MSSNTGFHNRAFDAGTLQKLNIYASYLKSAVAVFLNLPPTSPVKSINIYDFFAGPGMDALGRYGSPLLAIKTILEMATAPQTKHLWGKPIYFHFFDRKEKSINSLQKNIKDIFGDSLSSHPHIKIEFKTSDFETSFNDHIEEIRKTNTANIVFIDQFGMAHFDMEKLISLSKCYYTDCMVFMASSSLHRFKELQNRFSDMGYKFKNPKDYRHVHTQILKAFREAPLEKKLFFGSFAFKKKTNIYGLIYFSGSRRGIDQFLRLCWKEDPVEGLANFFLHEDQPNKDSQLLFAFKKTHIENLQEQFKLFILENHPISESALYDKCCDLWMLPEHCEPVLKKLKDNKILQCSFRRPQPNQDREITYFS